MYLPRWFPRSNDDRIAFMFFTIAVHLVPIYELFVILPYIDADRTGTFWLHATLGFFLYFNVISSFVKLIKTDSSTAGHVLPTLLKPGWKYCSQCQTNSPPRSAHCWTCNLCITRRDHHCLFIGHCIGQNNLRYFLSLSIYLTIGVIYCNFLNVDYTLEILGGFTLKAMFTMFLPLFSWALSYSGAMGFLASLISATCLFSMFLLLFISIYHITNVFRNQTCPERVKGDWSASLNSWDRNAQCTLGTNYVLAVILPYINYPQPSGFEFKSSLVKEM